ncbi:MAG: B12-binding domain-containing protein, partial [Planctomycetota bacterium]
MKTVKISDLRKAIIEGREDRARDLTKKLIRQGIRVRQILDSGLIAGMEEIGKGFMGKYFVPEALVAGRAFNAAMRILGPFLVAGSAKPLATVVIGTVKGDLHDIGKNLVAMMLRGANFRVEDLGIDVDKNRFVEKIQHLI